MITLKELFDDLAYGEFASMALGNSSTGSITPDKYSKVISFINLGLLDLYTRFQLKKKECIVYQQEDKNIYYIRSEHMGDVTAGDSEIYIDGLVDNPPKGDIIKFIDAYDEDGNQIHINKAKYPNDIFLLEPDVIKIKPSDPLKIMYLVYQAAYPKITIEVDFDPETYELFFPMFLRTALLANIASRLFVGKEAKALEGEQRLSNTFYYRYESECVKISNNSLIPDVTEEDVRFTDNGWV